MALLQSVLRLICGIFRSERVCNRKCCLASQNDLAKLLDLIGEPVYQIGDCDLSEETQVPG